MNEQRAHYFNISHRPLSKGKGEKKKKQRRTGMHEHEDEKSMTPITQMKTNRVSDNKSNNKANESDADFLNFQALYFSTVTI